MLSFLEYSFTIALHSSLLGEPSFTTITSIFLISKVCFKIEFNYYSLCKILKERSFIRERKEDGLEDVLSEKQNHTIWNKCYKVSFIKKIYADMPSFYSYYNEDYYQMGIIEYYAKKKGCIKKPLHVYIVGTGITSVKKYEKEKLKKILLSIYNVEANLIDFYKKNNADFYIPLVQSYSEILYRNAILQSKIKDFVEVSKEVLDDETINSILIKTILSYERKISFIEKIMGLLRSTKIILKPLILIYRYFKYH